ncbi:Hypothetical protein, putative [Bodo saltans]|uniref:Uncharacterized protein n=1 Tax=Bodo saltans TaxID=75058 RepID=A0A0S4KJB1_BODSA|nr:Hypothetical protein, putative [Bodo saltans]|eukprot:CUI14612.1 Hypothetical protein, putative [Bodo saltans]
MGCESSKQNVIEIEDAQFRDLEVRMSNDKGKKITLRSAAMAVRVASVRNPLTSRASKDAKRASLLGGSSHSHQQQQQPPPGGTMASYPASMTTSATLTNSPAVGYGGGYERTMLQPFDVQQKTMSNLSNRSIGTYGSSGGITTSTTSTKESPNLMTQPSMSMHSSILRANEIKQSSGLRSPPQGDMDVQSVGDDDDMDS